MKIEVKLHHPSGDIGSYPVHKLVRNNDGWTASYVTVKAGRHEGRKVKIEEGKAELEVNMEQGKPEPNPESELMKDRNGIAIFSGVAYIGKNKDISIRKFDRNNSHMNHLAIVYLGQALAICNAFMVADHSTIKAKLSSLLSKAAYAIRQAEIVQEYIKQHEVER